jgi:hypothetical protein
MRRGAPEFRTCEQKALARIRKCVKIIIVFWGGQMRFLNSVIFACVFAISAATAQSSDNFDNYFRLSIKPQLDAYGACALNHLEKRAKSDPAVIFDQVEGSLKSACGGNIDRAKDAMYRIGLTRPQANENIRKWYLGIQSEIRSYYEQVATNENRTRNQARHEADKRRQENEVSDERKKLMNAAVSEHNICLRREIMSIVPYSEESAETLGTVIMTKCSDHEKKRVSLAVALFGINRVDVEKILKEISDETRKHIVAEIVTARAEIAKSRGQPSSSGAVPKVAPTI